MDRKKLLVVVGAGASSEVGLPVGNELKSIIAKMLNFQSDGSRTHQGDDLIASALQQIVQKEFINLRDIDKYYSAGTMISKALPLAMSIDNFVNSHKGNKYIELCSKLAIVRSILKAEKGSKLSVDKSNIYNNLVLSKIEHTWYTYFHRLLTENCQIEELKERLSSISIIIFNYDRCIEHFLFHSLQQYYGIDPKDAADLVNAIEIFHPYGVVGHLPWQSGPSNIEYGADPNRGQLIDTAGQIKTFTEGTDPESSDIASIKDRMSHSESIVFLGFAFHPINMQLLKPEKPITNSPRFFATAKGFSAPDAQSVGTELRNLCKPRVDSIYMSDLPCAELFQEYWRSLSGKFQS